MIALIQRVLGASVDVGGAELSRINKGYLIFLGVASGDKDDDLEWLAQKIQKLRLFPDSAGKMNLALAEVEGEILLVSQFTLLADTRKGNRPSFTDAARPEMGKKYYEKMIERLRELGVKVSTGEFGADMKVNILNDGPVTIWIDSLARA